MADTPDNMIKFNSTHISHPRQILFQPFEGSTVIRTGIKARSKHGHEPTLHSAEPGSPKFQFVEVTSNLPLACTTVNTQVHKSSHCTKNWFIFG
jgi:hypothetical protein